MTNRTSKLLGLTAIVAALALTGCSRVARDEGNLANLDNQLVGNDTDPALTSAINDQIMVDPTLANQSNRNAVRPPQTPTQAQYPAETGGAPAGGKAAGKDVGSAAARSGAPCAAADFKYAMDWANRLSPAFPVYPGAKVVEAAGQDRAGCNERVVSFTSADPWQRVIEYYRGRAQAAGYSAEQQARGADQVLGGTNERDGGAYYLIVTPMKSGGSDISLLSNNGK
ncbi:MAG: hypothetical protein JWO25_3549 [Alphaproteobacteria bacterium]|nr:hypothetical protein [Alphaproteobacteria bacterium]MDB5721250.1 hypothetical protein [Alphaproteobacteria bacterium]